MASKFVEFTPSEYKATPKHPTWRVDSKRDRYEVGYVHWDSKWRRYVFAPIPFESAIFDAVCLRDIADFIGGRNGQK